MSQSTKEAAAELRARLKKMGYNARQVSVRTKYASMMSELIVTIRDVRVRYATVKELAEEYERVTRDSITGEILGGGNCYLDIRQTDERCEILARRHIEALEDAVESIPLNDGSSLAKINARFSIGRSSPGVTTFQLWRDDTPLSCFQGDEYGIPRAALQVALGDKDQMARELVLVK